MDEVEIHDDDGTNYRLDVDWGVNDVDRNLVYQVENVGTGNLEPSTNPTTQIDGGDKNYTVTHLYNTAALQSRPDSSADILAVFTFSFDFEVIHSSV